MPDAIWERSTSRLTFGSRYVLIPDRTIEPITTPQIEPIPPSTTIARMKIENENVNCVGLTVVR